MNFNVRVIKLSNGIIPFGSVVNFVHPSRRKQFYKRISDSCEPIVGDVRVVESRPVGSSSNSKSVKLVPKKEICVPEQKIETSFL